MFKKTAYFKKFDSIIESIYSHSGRIVIKDAYNRDNVLVEKGLLVYADTNEILTLTDDKKIYRFNRKR